jgi:hypothetical protein
MRPVLPIAVAAALACGATLSGCGGGGEGTTVDAAGFVAAADRVCRQTQREFDQVQSTATTTPEQVERQVEGLIDVAEQALAELRKLDPPEASASAYDRYLDSREEVLGHLEDGRDAAADRDAQAYAEAKRKAAAGAATRLSLAREAGLGDCSRPSVSFGG